MKRKTKFILIGLVALISLIIAINFNKIKYSFDMLSLYNRDKKIEASDNELDNPDDDILLVNPLESIVDNGDENNSDDKLMEDEETGDDQASDKATVDSTTSSNTKASSKSYTSIITDYNNQLKSLQAQFEGDLDNLISQGYKDYSSGNISKMKLASNYLSKGSSLEESSDAKFKSLVNSMEKELKENNHDTSITKEIETYYTSFKNSKKSNLISKGMTYLD